MGIQWAEASYDILCSEMQVTAVHTKELSGSKCHWYQVWESWLQIHRILHSFRSYSIAVWFRSLCSTYATSQCSLTKHVYVSWNVRHSPKQCVDMEPFNLLNNSMPQYCLPRYFIERIEAQRGETRTPQSSTEPWFILSWHRASRTAR